MTTIDIIVPCYNEEEGLENFVLETNKVIDTLPEYDFRYILVNDGSPDDSEKYCLDYQKKYPDNVVYIKKENGGLADARNVGLEYVKGEIVNFCDPDDILEKNVCTLGDFYF